MKFGSRIDVFIPKSAEIKVKLDDTVVGGETILAIV
ncbi:MAG: phosphatidylserine decarboxylase [Bacteroidota bacterium]|nr:phosphatidylserine decarboxylase [Bacteroidota bacterium]